MKFNEKYEEHMELELIIAGPADRKMKAIIDACQAPNFKYLGPLSLSESLKLQKSAHCLVIVDSNIAERSLSMFFPSKILEYFVARRRILALTNSDSTTSQVMKEIGFESFDFQDHDRLANHFGTLLKEFKAQNESFFSLKSLPDQYSAVENVKKLGELIHSM